MNYIEMNNAILNQYIRLINNINESPDHVVNQIIRNYEPIGDSTPFQELQLNKRNMDNNTLKIFDRTISISIDIDGAISECKEHGNIEGLRNIIRSIVITYDIEL
ncbi:MAG: hypothetical protein RSF67_05080 [Clostridia bacterium]